MVSPGFFPLSTIQRYNPGLPENRLCTVMLIPCRLYAIRVGYSIEKRWICGNILLLLWQ